MPTTPLKLSAQTAPQGDVIDITPAAQPSLPAAWQKARQWIDLSALYLASSCACQVMVGMELLGLHKAYNISQGKRHDLKNSFHDERSWRDAVKAEIGVSETTAWRWMEMAKVAKKRLAADHTDLAALLDQAPATLSEAEREVLKRAVHKITDGQTQSELMLEWGITTRGGGTPKGGNLGGGSTPALTNGGEGDTTGTPVEQVPPDVVYWAKALPELNLELCVRSSWTKLPIHPEDCPRANLTNLRQILADSLAAIDAHIKSRS